MAALPNGNTPLVDTSQAECFNLSVLKRMDEDILEILYSATHVAVYEFDTLRKSWKRSDIEGTLFLVKRCSAPRFRMIVVNSKRIDNFTEEVDGSLECEVLQTFLLYTKGNNQLYGIWFYEEKNCEEFGVYLKKIVKGMPKASPCGTPTIRTSLNTMTTTTAAEKMGSDFRNELQSIFNQLSGQQQQQSSSSLVAGNTSSSAASLSLSSPPQPPSLLLGQHQHHHQHQRVAATTTPATASSAAATPNGESEHLMRLFLQAKERAPTTMTPTFAELPNNNAEVVLSLDTTTVAVNAPNIVTTTTTTAAAAADVGPSSVAAAVPLIPLPPDFFKPSSKTPATTTSLTDESRLFGVAPDPVNLPLPSPETTSGRGGLNIGLNLLGAAAAAGIQSNGVDGDNVVSSLARFFAKNEEEEEDDDVVVDGNLRDRFRQALVNLLSNDEILDVLIAEFKKVGIPIQ